MAESQHSISFWGGMCLKGLALVHPAADLLMQWAESGCPAMTGKDWTVQQVEAAINLGPHVSALTPEAQVAEKVGTGQARVVEWNSIKQAPPPQLKISSVVAIPHKSKAYRSIVDLSFHLRLDDGGVVLVVNETSIKSAPGGAIDQIGHALK